MEFTKMLAELEREIYNKHYLKAEDLKEHLKELNSHTIDELKQFSKYSREDILKIANYWGGLE